MYCEEHVNEAVKLAKEAISGFYESDDELIHNSKQNYTRSFYFSLIDKAQTFVEERHTSFELCKGIFGFLYKFHGNIRTHY